MNSKALMQRFMYENEQVNMSIYMPQSFSEEILRVVNGMDIISVSEY